jgi:hypothetical protein
MERAKDFGKPVWIFVHQGNLGSFAIEAMPNGGTYARGPSSNNGDTTAKLHQMFLSGTGGSDLPRHTLRSIQYSGYRNTSIMAEKWAADNDRCVDGRASNTTRHR